VSQKIIERVLIKNLLFFDEIDLVFNEGLVVFSGASGAGKSMIMSSILSNFGLDTPTAGLSELTINNVKAIEVDGYEIDDEFAIKVLKSDKSRYYLDGQKISKKALKAIFKPPFISHLSVRDQDIISSKDLIEFIDNIASKSDREFKKELKEYKKRFGLYKIKLNELASLQNDQSKVDELIEFTSFEIAKIDEISPKIGEEEELFSLKQKLSKIDKIKEATQEASSIFELESKIIEVYSILEQDSSFVTDAFNQIRADFDDVDTLSEELEEINIEALLDRIEKISTLTHKYGSIEEALAYRDTKQAELEKYKNISYDMQELKAFVEDEEKELIFLAQRVDTKRQEMAKEIQAYLYEHLKELKLPAIHFEFIARHIDELGAIDVDITMNGSRVSTLSGGEFNRLRIALMVVAMERGNKKDSGVIILDEIDANVSGDESIAIANLIAKLAKEYQIFAISHQPHLSAKANQHILIKKENNQGFVEILDKRGQINEIARIIAGENANSEAVKFAKKLLG
jgi:DNA repair protein RecN (Recombination protein N)